MGTLFNLPKRKEEDIFSIIKKSQEYVKPKISIRGTSLADRIKLIEQNIIKHDCLLLDTDKKFTDYVDSILEDEYCVIDTETTGLEIYDQKQMVGLCIKGSNHEPSYVPVGHINNITEDFDINNVSKECMKENLLKLKGKKLVFHNSYFDLVVLYYQCGYIFTPWVDTLAISIYLDENESHSLKDLYTKYVLNQEGEVDKFGELFNGIPFCNIPANVACNYASNDVKMTQELWEFYKPFVTKGTKECEKYKLDRISDLIFNIEIPLQPYLAEMKIRGIEFDFKRAKELHDKYTKLRDEAQAKLESLISEPINSNSPTQVAELLFDRLKLKDLSGHRRTGVDFLEKMNHPVPEAILGVRTYDKMLRTFIDKLTEIAKYDGCIHTNFNSSGATATGRFSSSNPSLQQIPSHFGDIRNMFKARDGYKFMGLDVSKQEIVASAEFSDSEELREAFHKNLDVYSHMASLAFKVPYEDCLEFYPDGTKNKEGKERRSKAKAVMLGLLYGKGTKATAEDLGLTYEDAENIINDIFDAFPTLRDKINWVQEFVKKHGYVESQSGRRRRLPDALLPEYEYPTKNKYEIAKLKAGLKRCRSFNEKMSYLHVHNIKNNNGFIARAIRQAFNSCIQGESALMMKKSLLNLFRNKRLQELGVRVVLTIHDEAIVEFPEEYEDEVKEIAVKCMKDGADNWKLDISLDVIVMKNWE